MTIDKTAILITGAAGGLGRAFVEMSKTLPGLDFIIATDIREEVTEMFDSEKKVLGFRMDAGSEESIKNVKNQLGGQGISVKYIINNAGIFMFQPVSEITEELLDKILKVNTYGPVLTVSVFLDDLIKTGGRVIQISSHGINFPTLFQPYPASKIALEALSVSMRQELGLVGVDLVLIRSGAINTPLLNDVNIPDTVIEKSRYAKYLKKFIGIAQKDVGKTVEAEAVANIVRRALTAGKPRRIYKINPNRTITLMSSFPQWLIDILIRRSVKQTDKIF
jgi:NAD(P)-dependent dehydrogenase (short-subunit alcohol dehydrogenase family)